LRISTVLLDGELTDRENYRTRRSSAEHYASCDGLPLLKMVGRDSAGGHKSQGTNPSPWLGGNHVRPSFFPRFYSGIFVIKAQGLHVSFMEIIRT
jgi:hypothetical protein